MKPLVCAVVFFTMTTSSFVACADGQDIHACRFEVKARCVAGEARVTLADGVVKRLEVNVDWCGLPGGLHYSCAIDSSRGDTESKWSQDGGMTIIANSSPFNPSAPDEVKVTVGRYVSIDLDEAQSLGRCGSGAELPRAIVIRAPTTACRVWLDAP